MTRYKEKSVVSVLKPRSRHHKDHKQRLEPRYGRQEFRATRNLLVPANRSRDSGYEDVYRYDGNRTDTFRPNTYRSETYRPHTYRHDSYRQHPYYLTPYQGPKRCRGKFACTFCGNTWSSAFSWRNTGQRCVWCFTLVYPLSQHRLQDRFNRRRGHTDNEGGKYHRSELCEMCIFLNFSCRELDTIVNQQYSDQHPQQYAQQTSDQYWDQRQYQYSSDSDYGY